MSIKELMCWHHNNKSKGTFYEIDTDEDKFNLTLSEVLVCDKCGKSRTKVIQTFEGLTLRELFKIREMVQSRGAIRRI